MEAKKDRRKNEVQAYHCSMVQDIKRSLGENHLQLIIDIRQALGDNHLQLVINILKTRLMYRSDNESELICWFVTCFLQFDRFCLPQIRKSAQHIMNFAYLFSGPICGKADLFHYAHESDCRKYGNQNHVPLERFCRSLIKVKFSTDQVRLLQDQAVVRCLFVTTLKNLKSALFQTFST